MCADHGYVLFHNPVITCSCKCIRLLTAVMQISNPLHPTNCCGRRDSREDRPDPLVGEGTLPKSSHHVHCIHTCKCNQLLTCVLPLIKDRKRGKKGIASSCMGGRRCGRGARGLRRASGPFVRLMTAAKAAITFITQKTGSSTALSTPCALPMTLSKSSQLASEAFTFKNFSFL